MSMRTVNGSTHSENGWRLVNRDECQLITDLSFMDTAPIRKGAAFEALSAWVHWYDANVPGEIVSATWGWSATNDVLGGWAQNNGSNHLSGTALDINASQYPWHGSVMRDRHPDRYAAIQRGIALFEGIIFWGAAWTSSRDEMHFQLGEGTAAGDGASKKLADFVARKVRNGRLIDGAEDEDIDSAAWQFAREQMMGS